MTASPRGIACRVFVAALFLGAAAHPASAGWVTFDFNSVNLTGSTATAQNTYVDGYMDTVLAAQAPGMTVAVVGARPTNSYLGDGHVVGPTSTTPLSLGTTDGGNPTSQHAGVDSFIDTYNSTEIDMTFSGGKIYGISFDYEIFPSGTCVSMTNCSGGVPDFTFKAGATSGTALTYLTALAVTPGNVADPYTHSQLMTTETAPQLGPKSFSYTFTNGVSYLAFVDWPVTIGIDNLKINTTAAVPEPASLMLLGSGLAAAYARRRRKQREGVAPIA